MSSQKNKETKLKYIRVLSLLLLCDSFLIFPWLTSASLWMAAIETDWGDAAAEHAPGQGDAGVYQPTTGECVCVCCSCYEHSHSATPPAPTHTQTNHSALLQLQLPWVQINNVEYNGMVIQWDQTSTDSCMRPSLNKAETGGLTHYLSIRSAPALTPVHTESDTILFTTTT